MTVNVSTILALPSFKDATLLTGSDHLSNVVTQVSISDSPITEIDYTISKPGDFYLSEFYFAKDSVASMFHYLEPIVDSNASGICILDEYLTKLPEEVLRYCDEHGLPVIMNSVNVPYAQMIREIMELIIADGQNMLLESQFSAIAADAVDEKMKLEILKNLNPRFLNSISVFYIIPRDNSPGENAIRDLFNMDVFCAGIRFKDGVLGLVSYDDSSQSANSRIRHYVKKLDAHNNVLAAGVSDSHIKLYNISKALNQALFAAEIALKTAADNRVIKYEELGIMKLLILLSRSPELEEFYSDIILSLKAYDQKNNSQLFETMCAYRKCHYQYRETAHCLYVHENTVRYRISKARELIEAKAPGDDFRETFSIALKCQDVLDLDAPL